MDQSDAEVKCFRCGAFFMIGLDSLGAISTSCPLCGSDYVHMHHEGEPIHPTERCPVCGGPALLRERCRCSTMDIKCPEGHRWHTCRVHKVLVVGDGHSRTGCTC